MLPKYKKKASYIQKNGNQAGLRPDSTKARLIELWGETVMVEEFQAQLNCHLQGGARVGFTAGSMYNMIFIVLLFIHYVLFSTQTTIKLLSSHPVCLKETNIQR